MRIRIKLWPNPAFERDAAKARAPQLYVETVGKLKIRARLLKE